MTRSSLKMQIKTKALEVEKFSDELDAKGTAPTAADLNRLKSMTDDLKRDLDHAERADAKELTRALGSSGDGSTSHPGAPNSRGSWAKQVADRVTKTAGEFGVKALSTGGIDVPSVVESVVTKPVEPVRVLDLLVNRKPLDGNEFEFLRQTVRTNNAAAVADGDTKPTSIYTFEDEFDRARVFAHLTEAIPQRYLADHAEIQNVLRAQMAEDLMLAIEESALTGDGIGEDFTGLANVVGVQTQVFATDVITTLRKARTLMTTSGETPTAWVLNHADLEALDLTREDGATGGFMQGIDSKVFGDLPKIGSSVVPAGTAYLGDWNQARLYVREGGRLDADMSGPLFDSNQVKLRYEGRFGLAYLRPSAFIEIDLTAA